MWEIIAGIIGGIVGGMGMGGGTILVPILTLFLGVEQKVSQLINIVSFLPMACIVIVLNAKAKLIKWRYVAYIGIPGAISSIGASFLVGRMDVAILRKCFGVFLLLLGAIFLVFAILRLIKSRRKKTLTSINVVKADDDD